MLTKDTSLAAGAHSLYSRSPFAFTTRPNLLQLLAKFSKDPASVENLPFQLKKTILQLNFYLTLYIFSAYHSSPLHTSSVKNRHQLLHKTPCLLSGYLLAKLEFVFRPRQSFIEPSSSVRMPCSPPFVLPQSQDFELSFLKALLMIAMYQYSLVVSATLSSMVHSLELRYLLPRLRSTLKDQLSTLQLK